jgi:hypothetical protein
LKKNQQTDGTARGDEKKIKKKQEKKTKTNKKRKMVPFIPDVDYHIQALFIVTFGYIWTTAF